jgi:hypothetical protein
MSAYQRFLPRDETRTAVRVIAEAAEAAEAAEVKAAQGSPAAQSLLKPAEVRPGDRQLQQASAEVQQRQTGDAKALQQPQQLQQGPDPPIARMRDRDTVSDTEYLTRHLDPKEPPPGVPAAWLEGVARLASMPPPHPYPAHAWQQLIVDAECFLDDWAPQAAALGWPDWELFGCHRRAPWGRIQGMGLVLLLRGDEIAALTKTEAVIRTRTGARQSYYRQLLDPLHPAERCLVWELA